MSTTTMARAWAVVRSDGVTHGFTDHDAPLTFEGITFAAQTGLTAKTVEQSTGLSVDNSEALGILSDSAISDADIQAGRFDLAEVKFWHVNWAEPEDRELRFTGSIGEIRRRGGEFHAELRGLTEALNQPMGRVFRKDCGAKLGDSACRVDITDPTFVMEAAISDVTGTALTFSDADRFDPDWFERGTLTVLTGAAAGLTGLIKRDRFAGQTRVVELWQSLGAPLRAGDRVRLIAGCDKRMSTCRYKFNNLLNFRGFPDIPGEDWLISTPISSARSDGGSLR